MADAQTVDPDLLEALYVDGVEMPLVQFGLAEPVLRLRLEGGEYIFSRSYPWRGFGAILGKDARQFLNDGKKVLVARFGQRLYLYVG